MKKFRNIHCGERVFILGTGPSIRQTPLDMLKDEYTISLGSIHLLYDQTDWRPTYYVSWEYAAREYMNTTQWHRRRQDEYVRRNLNKNTTLFLSSPAEETFGNLENVYYYNPVKRDENQRDHAIKTGNISSIWSDDITECIYNFGGTMSVAPQIANYMGFDEIYFLGCDLFKDDRPHMIFESANDPSKYVIHDSTVSNYLEMVSDGKPIRSSINAVALKLYTRVFPKSLLAKVTNDENHFSDKYAPSEVHDAKEKNKGQTKTHRVVELASNKYGFNVYNATLGGRLEVYDRVDLMNVLD